MTNSNLDEIITEYDSLSKPLSCFLENFSDKISLLLKSNSIRNALIDSRLKEKSSLLKKVSTESKYEKLSDVTDVMGMRIILPLEDDVKATINLIRGWGKIDYTNTVDKRFPQDNEAVGYLLGYRSYHIVAYNKEASSLPPDFRIEIQIRTILQHAWAEIEHRLGYKLESGESLKSKHRRRFTCLAGLLEIGDREFSQLAIDIDD